MTAVQSFSSDSRSRFAGNGLLITALIVSFAPWTVVAFKLLLVAVDAPFALIETAISAIFKSIPVSVCAWLGLTLLTLVFGGWRRGALALIGFLPLGLISFITITWLNR